ncbi:Nitrilase [Rubripirellula tenax]|uniref:Nitrilase n=1 Tax=Rubripirellula tenax TaxID=2528015 RepID=A0A5C6FJJ2_9BACT|nr:carbon-nitrogen hydrolase family protein [Rubripirellula tenax]TWU59802.1 Nitrilase [Rubripirellula tenax]
MRILIALVQFEIAPSQPEINLPRMESFIRQAAKQGAQLVVFPEDAINGPLEGQTDFVGTAPACLEAFQQLAIKYEVDLVPGTWTVQEGDALYNTAHYINKDGSVAGVYRKINLWETEKAKLTPGTTVSVFPTAYGMVGMIICWDISFPALFAEMVKQGVRLVISPTYWSFPRSADCDGAVDDEILLIDSLCTTRAFDNNIVFAYCNAGGELKSDDWDVVLSGRSQITHPLDKVLCKATSNGDEIVFAAVSIDEDNPIV